MGYISGHYHRWFIPLCRIDCVGILKLRNTDVEKRIGLLKTKKKSTKCRLIFRVNIPQNDGNVMTLQTVSTVVACSEYYHICLNIYYAKA